MGKTLLCPILGHCRGMRTVTRRGAVLRTAPQGDVMRVLEPARRALAQTGLRELAASPGLSANLSDIVQRTLAG